MSSTKPSIGLGRPTGHAATPRRSNGNGWPADRIVAWSSWVTTAPATVHRLR